MLNRGSLGGPILCLYNPVDDHILSTSCNVTEVLTPEIYAMTDPEVAAMLEQWRAEGETEIDLSGRMTGTQLELLKKMMHDADNRNNGLR